MTRRTLAGCVLGAVIINVALACAAMNGVGAAARYQTAEPSEMVWYSGIVRRENKSTPWHFVADPTSGETGHTLVGFASVTCDWTTGALHVRAPFTAVAGAVTQPDETFVRRGIDAGPSIANDDMRIYFSYGDGAFLSCSNPATWGSAANVWVSMHVTP